MHSRLQRKGSEIRRMVEASVNGQVEGKGMKENELTELMLGQGEWKRRWQRSQKDSVTQRTSL